MSDTTNRREVTTPYGFAHGVTQPVNSSATAIPGIRITLKSGRQIEIDDIDLISTEDDGKRQKATLWTREIRIGC